MKTPKNIAITGASSGLGAALAAHYAAPGVVLFLHGRNHERLNAVAESCKKRAATTHLANFDVTDAAAVRQWLEQCDACAPVDLVIANAGVSAGFGNEGESPAQVEKVFSTNLGGVLNTVQPLLPMMKKRGRGQIAIVSSLAGIRALPSCPAYSASKAAVRYYGEALRGAVQFQGVEVSVICPGYIITPMTTNNPFPMPLLMSAEKAACIIARALAKNRARIAFPLTLYIPLWLIGCLPPWLTDPFFARLPKKPSL